MSGKELPHNSTKNKLDRRTTVFSPLYVKSVSLSGIRCFRGPTQNLTLTDKNGEWARWTLILGNNGTGKSTLLKVISRVTVVEDFSYRMVFKNLGVSEKDLDGLDQSGPAIFINDDRDVKTHVSRRSGKLHTSDFSELIQGHYSGDCPHEKVELISGGQEVRTACVYYDSHPEGLNLPLMMRIKNPRWTIFGYGAWRSLGQHPFLLDSDDNTQCPHLFSDKHQLINAEEWLLRLDYGAEKESSEFAKQHRERFNQVREMLLRLLPDNEISDIRVAAPAGPDLSPRALFKTPYGEVELQQLGYGYQSLIAWVVDFAARMFREYPSSKDPLSEPAVCLIDEIDLHLHPVWQRKLMRFLSERFPRTQFIATAHSPLVVQAAEEVGANVVVLRREGNHVVIDNDPISVKGWRVDQILSSELFNDTPSRDAETEKWMARRVQLLQKEKLSAKEKAELKQLNEKVQNLPMASSPEDRNLDRRLKAAVELLEKAAKGTK